jgi:hypothetical protein
VQGTAWNIAFRTWQARHLVGPVPDKVGRQWHVLWDDRFGAGPSLMGARQLEWAVGAVQAAGAALTVAADAGRAAAAVARAAADGGGVVGGPAAAPPPAAVVAAAAVARRLH